MHKSACLLWKSLKAYALVILKAILQKQVGFACKTITFVYYSIRETSETMYKNQTVKLWFLILEQQKSSLEQVHYCFHFHIAHCCPATILAHRFCLNSKSVLWELHVPLKKSQCCHLPLRLLWIFFYPHVEEIACSDVPMPCVSCGYIVLRVFHVHIVVWHYDGKPLSDIVIWNTMYYFHHER